MGTSVAQVDYATATLQGVVFDPQDKVITGARITTVNEANGAVKTALSSSEGYQIPSLTPGTYRIEAEAAGFSKSVAKDVFLTVGQLAAYDIHLKVGPEATTVEVVATIPLSQPEQTQQANLIDSNQVENLPNITRSFVESIYTIPGVVNSSEAALQNPGVGTAYLSSGFSIGGSNGRNNLVTIDGGENDYGSGALRENHVPIDSIQEFQVNRNAFESEFGFTIGTAINMVTRSGGNRIQGSLAGYFRDRATDAENHFNKLAGGGGKPFEQSAIASATLGGPIRRNRLFFFTAPEYQKLDSATVQDLAGEAEFQGISSQTNGYKPSSQTCPNQNTAQQQVTQLCYLTQLANSGGGLSALGTSLLSSPIFGNPLSNPILNALVSPNDGTFDGILSGPSGTGARNIPGFNTPRGRYFNWVTRIDYLPGSRDTLAFRFSLMHEIDNVSPAPPYSGSEPQRDYTLTGNWTHVFSSNLLNTVRVQVVPQNTFSYQAPNPNGSEIDLGNQIQLGTPFAWPYNALFRRFQADDSLSLVTGNHRLKFGGSWRPDYYSVNEKLWAGGQWEFDDGAFTIMDIVAGASPATASALASYNLSQGYPAAGPASTNLTAVQSFLAGTPAVLLQANPASNTFWSGWAQSLGLYAQDSWKVSPHLTMNYGLRLDYDRDASPVPHSVWVTPRAGIAWQPGGDQKTVFRAGGGLFVAPNLFMIPFYTNLLDPAGTHITQGALVAGLPPPFPSIFAAWALQESKATIAEPNPPLTNADLSSLGAAVGPPGPTAFGNVLYTLAPNFKPAYTIQASFSAARELRRDLTIELSYLMYRSVHIEQILETNFVRNTQVPIDPFAGPQYIPRPGTTDGEPNSSIFQNDAFSSVGDGIYNGGTVSLNRHLAGGLQFQMNYTLSRAIDDTSDFSVLTTPFRPDALNQDRAVSDFNIKHNFVANAVYKTPFRGGSGGFIPRMLAGVTVAPIFYARSGVPFTLLVPGLSNGTIGHNAYARPWNEGRNDGIGPAFLSVDLRISKELIRSEKGHLDVIAQAQNLLNRTNFAAVNNNFPVDPNYPLPGGGTLGNGPFNVRGFAPDSITQLSQPLAFTSAYPARQVSLALRFAF